MENDKAHAALTAQLSRLNAKASPLILAAGIIQEYMAISEALHVHAEALNKKLNELQPAIKNDPTVPGKAR